MAGRRNLSAILTNKKVIITGGSSGIGKAAAKLFAANGAHVFIIARRKDVLKQAADEIGSLVLSKAQKIIWVSVDVSDREQVEAWAQKYHEEYGAPDIIINGAGIVLPGYFEELPYDSFDDTMKIDYYGVLNMCHAFIPMMKTGGGHIVNISSMAGFLGVFGYTTYSAAKFAVIGFSQSLRSEMKRYSINISVLCPPDTDTPQLEEEMKVRPKETKAVAEGAGVMSADEVAQDMVIGMIKKRFMIVPSINAKFVYLVQRIMPSLVEWIMDMQIKKA
ncbi:MAG: SDR family oxidoreductase [Deltaproteobacteria bacterium]|nr:SDR family oxidoreductase [Deltaproteobacteria bacterium]